MIYVEWHEEKARSNLREHKLSFQAAARVFDDPFRITEEDSVVEGEQRWRTVGIADGIAIVLVIYLEAVWENNLYVRMISARKATSGERRFYEQHRALFGG